MIGIQRCDPPEHLIKPNPNNAQRWDHSSVRSTLRQMQHNKCCYCETRLTDSYIEIEHFKPKAHFPELEQEWTNLMLACRHCNGAKFDSQEAIVDPSAPSSNPEEHVTFRFDGHIRDGSFGVICANNGSPHGQATIETVKLDRKDHAQARKDWYHNELVPAICALDRVHDIASTKMAKAAARLTVEGLLEADSPFASFARCFAREKKLDAYYGVTIPS